MCRLFFTPKMLKPCEGIQLQPIKFTPTTSKDGVGPPLLKRSIYIPPSKRAEMKPEDIVLTAEDMDSATLFPTLGPMPPATNGASWNQIRTRLTKPLVNVVEEAIERERKEAEEGMRREMETDPTKMTEQQRKANGWDSITIPSKLADFSVIDPEYPWNVQKDWLNVPDFTPDIMNDSSKFLKYATCMNADGSDIERAMKRSATNPLIVVNNVIEQQGTAFQKFWGATLTKVKKL